MAGGGMPESNDERTSLPGGDDAVAVKREQVLRALLERLDDLHRQISALERQKLAVMAELDASCDDWETYGAEDTAHYVSMRTDIPYGRARRGVALASLPA